MNCDLCLYWEWRLQDLRLSYEKAPSDELMVDIWRVEKRLEKHRERAHWERRESTA